MEDPAVAPLHEATLVFLDDTNIHFSFGGYTIPTTKEQLIAIAPYFEMMFGNASFRENHQQVIQLQIPRGICPQAVATVLFRLLVPDLELTITPQNVTHLLSVAAFYQIDGLRDKCLETLTGSLIPQNCLKVLQMAMYQGHHRLVEQSLDIIAKNFHSIRNTDDFLRCDVDELVAILRLNFLSVFTEQDIYQAVVEWFLYDMDHRWTSDVQNAVLPELRYDLLEILADSIVGNRVHDMAIDTYHHEPRAPQRNIYHTVYIIRRRSPNSNPVIEEYDYWTDSWTAVRQIQLDLPPHHRIIPVVVMGNDIILQSYNNDPNNPAAVAAALYHPLGMPMAAGGGANSHTATMYGYAPTSGQWHEITNPNALPKIYYNIGYRSHFCMTAYGCYMYKLYRSYRISAQEQYAADDYNEFKLQDPVSGSWSAKAGPQYLRFNAVLVSVDDRYLYFYGGYTFADPHQNNPNPMYHYQPMYLGGAAGSARVPTNTVERYDMTNDRWERCGDMLVRRANFLGKYHNGYLYALGGQDDQARYLNTCERMSLATGQWEMIAPMHKQRVSAPITYRTTQHGDVFVCQEKLFVCGGNSGQMQSVYGGYRKQQPASVEMYDIVRNQWVLKKNLKEDKESNNGNHQQNGGINNGDPLDMAMAVAPMRATGGGMLCMEVNVTYPL